MRFLIIAVIPICGFLLGWLLARLNRQPPDVRNLALAEEVINDLSIMCAEHQQYGDPLATLALSRIGEYRHERNRR